jgi:hypothetical protein
MRATQPRVPQRRRERLPALARKQFDPQFVFAPVKGWGGMLGFVAEQTQAFEQALAAVRLGE